MAIVCNICESCSLAWMYRASWNTIPDVKPSMTRNVHQARGTGKGEKGHTRKNSKSQGWQGDILITQLSGHQGITMSSNATQHLLSSPARGYKSVHFLNLSASSWLHVVQVQVLAQSDKLVISFFSYNVYNGACIHCFILCFICPYVSPLTC